MTLQASQQRTNWNLFVPDSVLVQYNNHDTTPAVLNNKLYFGMTW